MRAARRTLACTSRAGREPRYGNPAGRFSEEHDAEDSIAEDDSFMAHVQSATATSTPELVRLLRIRHEEILEGATAALTSSRIRHYNSLASTEVRLRLENLYMRVVDAVEHRDLTQICAYGRELARERYENGYDLGELQTAFNAMEEALWRTILHVAPPALHAEALALVTTVVGAAKDSLAREYVSLSARHRAPALDVGRLFEGVERVEGP